MYVQPVLPIVNKPRRLFHNRRNTSSHRVISDSSLRFEHKEIADCLIEAGALTFNRLRNVCATMIQAKYRGYRIRKNFNDYRGLLLKYLL